MDVFSPGALILHRRTGKVVTILKHRGLLADRSDYTVLMDGCVHKSWTPLPANCIMILFNEKTS